VVQRRGQHADQPNLGRVRHGTPGEPLTHPRCERPLGWRRPHQRGPCDPPTYLRRLLKGGGARFPCAVTCGKSARWHGGVMSLKGSTPIRPITGRPSLAPAPATRCPNRFAYAFLARRAGQRAYQVPYRYLNGLGRASRPVARHLRQGNAEPLHLATYPFGSSLTASSASLLACRTSRPLPALHLG